MDGKQDELLMKIDSEIQLDPTRSNYKTPLSAVTGGIRYRVEEAHFGIKKIKKKVKLIDQS